MKHGISALLLTLALLGCSKKESSLPESPTIEWSQPAHQSLEVYINQYTLSPTQGAIGRPNLEIWRPNVHTVHTYSTNQEGKPPYTAKLEYKGTAPEGDHYFVTITHPIDSNVETIELNTVFTGTEIEFFKDTQYRIGIRPRTDNSNSEQVSGGNG